MSKRIMNETELADAMESLPGQIKPQRDLWPGINSRLETQQVNVAAVAKTSTWRVPAMEYSLAGTVETTEREYQAAFRELVPLDYSGMRLAGDDPESIRGSWDELQKAESSLLAALREFPANIFLNEKLMDLRSQQLQFVKQMVLLEQNNWRRT